MSIWHLERDVTLGGVREAGPTRGTQNPMWSRAVVPLFKTDAKTGSLVHVSTCRCCQWWQKCYSYLYGPPDTLDLVCQVSSSFFGLEMKSCNH